MKSEDEIRQRIEQLSLQIAESESETLADGLRDGVTREKRDELLWVLDEEVSEP